jgi:NADPH:quinone reductase
MKALTLDSFESSPRVREDLPPPDLGDDEVLIRVRASSVNPVDTFIAMGAMKEMMGHEFPVVLGRDLAGAIERVGSAVTRHTVGDEVYGYLPTTGARGKAVIHDGALAEYVAVREGEAIAHRPVSVAVAEAGAVPLAAITALSCVDTLEISDGDRVLIVGASGGVGSFATQLAALGGAQVIAPALAEDEAYLRELGAAEIIDRGGDVAAVVRERYPDGIDGLIDVVNREPEAFAAFAANLKPGGRAATPLNAADLDTEGITASNVMASPEPARLTEVAELIDAGKLRVPIQRTYSLDEAPQAFQDLHGSHTRGKLAIAID